MIIVYTASYLIIAFISLIITKLCFKDKFSKMDEEQIERNNLFLIFCALLFPLTIGVIIILAPIYIGLNITKIMDKFYVQTK